MKASDLFPVDSKREERYPSAVTPDAKGLRWGWRGLTQTSPAAGAPEVKVLASGFGGDGGSWDQGYCWVQGEWPAAAG